MDKTEKIKFVTYIHDVAKLCRTEMNPEITDLWIELLSPWSFEDIRKAFIFYLRTEKFMPSPSDIVNILAGNQEEAARRALTKVVSALDNPGPYRTVVFDDPVIHATLVELGGWLRPIGFRTDREYEFWRRDFLSYYDHFAKIFMRGDLEYPSRLLGLTDRENASLGALGQQALSTSKPVYIGDPSKARETEVKGISSGSISPSLSSRLSHVSLGKSFPSENMLTNIKC